VKRFAAFLALGATLAASASALAAPTVANAWMRPAAKGAASADAYADLRTDVPVTLVAVKTPVARAVEIVVVDPKDASRAPRVVESLALPAGETRFALRGSVLRLVDVARDLSNATPVPLRFEFRDAAGATLAVDAEVQVRGLVAPAPR
jgi:periplasmic copper chaperone A